MRRLLAVIPFALFGVAAAVWFELDRAIRKVRIP